MPGDLTDKEIDSE